MIKIDPIFTTFLTLLTVSALSIIFNILFAFRFNGWKFFRAGKKLLLIHPKENRRLSLEVAKDYGGLAQTKEGFFMINPDDVFIDTNSKVPCTFVYGKNALSINIKAGAIARKLKELGIDDPYKLAKTLKDSLGENKTYNLNILGESVPLHEVPNYFFTNERPDLIEAEIQNRVSAVAMAKQKTGMEILKYLIIFGVFLIIAVIAFNMLMMAKDTGSGIDTEQLKNLIATVKEPTKVVSESASAGTTVIE